MIAEKETNRIMARNFFMAKEFVKCGLKKYLEI